MTTNPQLELLYEGTPKATNVIEYGGKFSDLMEGKLPGPAGATFDLMIEDYIKGKLQGKVKAVVTMHVQPDGISTVRMHETLTTDDGESILFDGTGISVPGDAPRTFKVRGAFRFFTSSQKYAWVNAIFGILEAKGNPAIGNFQTKVYVLS